MRMIIILLFNNTNILRKIHAFLTESMIVVAGNKASALHAP